jgi:hypothetical protein
VVRRRPGTATNTAFAAVPGLQRTAVAVLSHESEIVPALRCARDTCGVAYRPNALKVRMVRVSWMPGMVCTFSLMKWPMSVPAST